MKVWIDAQLSPLLAEWLRQKFQIEAQAVRDLGLRDAKDIEIFQAARKADAVILTKDADFSHLLDQHGTPPQVIWLTCGNTSKANLRRILETSLPQALKYLQDREPIVEISASIPG